MQFIYVSTHRSCSPSLRLKRTSDRATAGCHSVRVHFRMHCCAFRGDWAQPRGPSLRYGACMYTRAIIAYFITRLMSCAALNCRCQRRRRRRRRPKELNRLCVYTNSKINKKLPAQFAVYLYGSARRLHRHNTRSIRSDRARWSTGRARLSSTLCSVCSAAST